MPHAVKNTTVRSQGMTPAVENTTVENPGHATPSGEYHGSTKDLTKARIDMQKFQT